MELVRLQKYLAQCGVGSRRKCEEYINQGRITIDGKQVCKQGIQIDPNRHIIEFDNKTITPEPITWIMLNKPPKYLSSSSDPSGKSTFLKLLPENKHHLFAVGRLDFLSEGLLLITNDGDTANKIIHPRYEIEKEYRVTTIDEINTEKMKTMQKGFTINDVFLSVKSIHLEHQNKKENHWTYSIVLFQGKNRHIREMLNYIDIRIRKLVRIRIGPISLTDVSLGKWRYLTKGEIKKLHDLFIEKSA